MQYQIKQGSSIVIGICDTEAEAIEFAAAHCRGRRASLFVTRVGAEENSLVGTMRYDEAPPAGADSAVWEPSA